MSTLIPVIVLGAFAMFVSFVLFWMALGWGVSIAVRVYCRAIRRHNRYLDTLPADRDDAAARYEPAAQRISR
jgi:hypothetical protein